MNSIIPPYYLGSRLNQGLSTWFNVKEDNSSYILDNNLSFKLRLSKLTTGGIVSREIVANKVGLTGDGTLGAVLQFISNVLPFITNTRLSMLGWFYLPANTGRGVLLSYGAATSTFGFMIGIGNTTVDNVGGNVTALAGGLRHINSGISYGGIGLHHFGFVLGGGQTVRLFLDGKRIYQDAGSLPTINPIADYAVLGTRDTGAFPRCCAATFFDVKMWCYPLDDIDVANIYAMDLAHFSTKNLTRKAGSAPVAVGRSQAFIF
jgi:hypothetical protein